MDKISGVRLGLATKVGRKKSQVTGIKEQSEQGVGENDVNFKERGISTHFQMG